MRKVVFFSVLSCLAILMVMSYACGNNAEKSENETFDVSEKIDSIKKESLKSVFSDGENNGWNYVEEKDEMTDGISKFATIVSENSEELDFPYGNVFAKIAVRKTKRYGTDVMIMVSSGQIFGNDYNNDNYIMVRFDENQPIKYYFAETSDGSSEVVFVKKVNDFIQRAKKANAIKVEIPFFNDGRRIFCFSTVEKLKW